MKKELVITESAIRQRVSELGKAVTRDYRGKKLVLVGVLNGAFMFLADLARAVDLPLELDFVRVASYGSGTCSSGRLDFSKDIELAVAGKDILLVEDIIDTGRTLACLKEVFLSRKPNSVRICALIDKKERREISVKVEYVGFEVQTGFLVGYGLDHAEQHRHYPAVYRLLPEK